MERTYPLVSVIIPVYNQEKFIVQAMNSVLLENYPNKELVIIDDGSSDNTAQLVQDWIEKHQNDIAVTFKSRENKGFIPTMNELIILSHGSHIVFFGSDDYLKNNGIMKRYEYLQAHPEKLMVVGDCNLIDGNDNITHESAYVGVGRANKEDLKTDAGLRKFMILNGYVPGATLMADKRIYDEFGLYDERLHAEDWVYYIRVVAKDRLGFLDEIVSAYRVHGSNMCFSNVQLLQAKEQFVLSFKIFHQFKLIDQFYFLKRQAFYLIYIPYLWLKFKLIDANQETNNTVVDGVLKTLVFFKKLFLQLFGREFARQ